MRSELVLGLADDLACLDAQRTMRTSRDLCEYVATEIPDKWEEFGIAVGVRRGDLRAIKVGRPKEKNGFIQVFDKWHNGMTSPYTWEKVAEALESSDVHSVRTKGRGRANQ